MLRLPAGFPAMLAAVTYAQLISGGVTIVITSVAIIAFAMVVLMAISKRLPMSVVEKVAVGFWTRDGVIPEMRLLVEVSMVRPLVIWLLVIKVKLPDGCVVGGLVKGVRVNEKGELLGTVKILATVTTMLLVFGI
jgi:hypothetical protein